MKKLSTAIVLLASMLITDPSYAGFGDLLGKKESKTSGDVYAMQDDLVKAYTVSATGVNNAQVLLAKAFDLKELVAELEAEQKALKDGSVSDEKSIKANKKLTENANNVILEKMKTGDKLSDEGRKYYVKAFPPYVQGLVGSKKIIDASEGFLDSAKSTLSSASFMEKAKVASKLTVGSYVASEAPGLVKNLWDTSKMMITYGKNNDIEVPADATEALGDISF